MSTEKDIVQSIDNLLDIRKNIINIIDGINSGKYNAIIVEKRRECYDTKTKSDILLPIENSEGKHESIILPINKENKNEMATMFTFMKSHISSLISSKISSIDKIIKS